MPTHTETERVQPRGTIVSRNHCAHGRLIDEVLTGNGTRSGKVRCLECGAQFDDVDLPTQ